MTARSWTSLAASVAVGLALSACATLKPKLAAPQAVVPSPAVQVPAEPASTPMKAAPSVAKAGACVPRSLPRAPRYPDTAEALRDAGGAADRYQLMAAGRILREKRLAELERAVDACR